MDLKIFILEFIDKFFNSSFVAVLFGGLLAGHFGLKQFKAQKNLDRIEEKYFIGGIEGLIKYLTKEREKIEDNYATCLLIAKYFRDLSSEKFLRWLEKDNVYTFKVVSSKMPREFFTVNFLLKDKNLKLNLESLFAKLQSVNDYFISDFIFCIKNFNNTQNKNKNTIYEKLVEEAISRNKEIENIYYAVGYLESILFEIRKMNIDNYSDIAKIRKNEIILKLLREANEKLAERDK